MNVVSGFEECVLSGLRLWRMVNGDIGWRQSILVQGTSVLVGLVLIYPVSIFAKVQSLENLRHIPVEFMHIDIDVHSRVIF